MLWRVAENVLRPEKCRDAPLFQIMSSTASWHSTAAWHHFCRTIHKSVIQPTCVFLQHHGTELYWLFEKEFTAQNVRTSVIYDIMVPSFFCYSRMGLPLIFPWMLHFRLTCQHFFLLFVIALSLVPCLSV